MQRCYLLSTFALTAFLAGCAVGPDFTSPDAPNVAAYSPHGLPDKTVQVDTTVGASQKFVPGGAIPAQWWEQFKSPALSALVIDALNNNPDLQSAEASLSAAQEQLFAAGGSLFPTIDGTASVTRSKPSSANTGVTRPAYSVYNASVSASYALDIFGGVRRALESQEAVFDAQKYQLEAAHLTLTSNVVTAAIQEASLRAQIAATQDIISVNKKSLDMLESRFNLGGIARSEVLTQSAALAQIEATLPPLEKSLAQTRHLLKALSGRLPSEKLDGQFDLEKFTLPEELPLSLPSQLVAQRPDIKLAEANLHQASAQIGVTLAAMLPQITLSASYGGSNGQLANLLSPESAIWNIGAGLTQPLFHGTQLWHQHKAANALYDAAAAQYRSTVISAFQNVADVLQALQSDAKALEAQLAAEKAAADSLSLSQKQYSEGAISHLTLLTAEQAYQTAKIALVQAEALRLTDTAALFQALGGGWHADKAPEYKSGTISPTVKVADSPTLTNIPPEPGTESADTAANTTEVKPDQSNSGNVNEPIPAHKPEINAPQKQSEESPAL